jgi:hypothetical protein
MSFWQTALVRPPGIPEDWIRAEVSQVAVMPLGPAIPSLAPDSVITPQGILSSTIAPNKQPFHCVRSKPRSTTLSTVKRPPVAHSTPPGSTRCRPSSTRGSRLELNYHR